MANQFTTPGKIILGKDALKMSELDLCRMGKKALIVTGKSMLKQGNVKILIDMLKKNGVGSAVYSEIVSEPTDKMIYRGLDIYNEKKCDFIIGFGGGSPLDAAKAIGAMATNEGRISDYNGKTIENPLPPVAAIPTTAGTGSEATQFTIVSDTKNDIKMLLKGKVLIPALAIVDPKFSYSSPKNVTAATGLDALTHAVEAYTSKKAFPLTDSFAISAVKRIFEYLPIVYKDTQNEKAREEMAIAALEAGISFNNSSVTIVHGMSRPIGALFHIPHGISNAILLKECMSFALDGAYDRFAQLARAIGAARDEDEDMTAGKIFIDKLDEICNICEVPNMNQYGIEKKEFFKVIEKMAKDAFDSGSPSNTRKDVTVEDMIKIYERLY
ncbi:MAG: iron-containing alcohol dehydrogenase [Clostridium sp.]|uniref:iron-containing alcohol dehydrogenase n=1 Tax=Clostridium sp. TaxID=1506 RepID=UPI0025C26543|nr:iron-containing alcohol dehydrogenase [Clostridium sp.]MCH3963966.1 iron-containing alcohol dehydrogenase [Clostridium sp.]MCI1716167.1 iron-containing alcohol dehydrogenase [Clostridium sp.]MCI1800593.1 iron-containing alcohol dehydrogenase [Clostridium sp.]MCI1814344.1 iron-containing alcohol dehydrogenase [Clostridium sp.]MCI1871243.1 iron-containing alcohol dehydrogenase [Clostridium sp.]